MSQGVKGYIAEEGGRIVGFSLADACDGSIFALFVLPAYERRGHGTCLHDAAVAWLRSQGRGVISLTTGMRSSAVAFYEHRGWRKAEVLPSGDFRMVHAPVAKPNVT